MTSINFSKSPLLLLFVGIGVHKITVLSVLTVPKRTNGEKYSNNSYYSYFLRTIYGTPVEKISMDTALKK